MDSNQRTLIALGGFTIAALVALTVLAVKVGSLSFGGGPQYRLVFASATGIPDNADVRVSGIPVGNVRRLALAPEGGAEVWVSVREDIALYDDVQAVIKQKSLLGERFIELRPGVSGRPLPAGGTVTNTITPFRIEDIGEVLGPLFADTDPAELQKAIGGILDFLLENREALAASAADIAEIIGRVNALLEAHGDKLGAMVENAIALARRLDRFLGAHEADVARAVRDVAALTGDLRTMVEAIRSAAGAFPSAGTDAAELIGRLNRLAARLERADPWSAALVLKKLLQEEGITVNLLGSSEKTLRRQIDDYRETLEGPAGSAGLEKNGSASR